MKLLTKDIEKQLKAQYKKHRVADREVSYCKTAPVVVKYFTPDANATWYILEGMPLESHPSCKPVLINDLDGRQVSDWVLFGLCDIGQGVREWGEVLLSQLVKLRGNFGLPVERDFHYSGTYQDLKRIAGAY